MEPSDDLTYESKRLHLCTIINYSQYVFYVVDIPSSACIQTETAPPAVVSGGLIIYS